MNLLEAPITPTCVVADNHPAVLHTLSRCLEFRGLSVVATATTSDDAEKAILETAPALALVDVSMPGTGGIEVLRRVQRAVPKTAVVVYTGSTNVAVAREALDAGARGFVSKAAPLEDLAEAIRTVLDGSVYVDPSVAFALLRADDPSPRLSVRELDVLRLLAGGHRYTGIGARLAISEETVRAHVYRAMKKVGARSRVEAVALAVRKSLIA